jgi:hypothetical protein
VLQPIDDPMREFLAVLDFRGFAFKVLSVTFAKCTEKFRVAPTSRDFVRFPAIELSDVS